MSRVFLVRHGRSAANVAGVLAGRGDSPLDSQGELDAADLGYRMAAVPLALAVCSPMLRTRATLASLVRDRDIPTVFDEALAECDYGDWTGQALSVLAKDPLWALVQSHPSAVHFPGGESMAQMSARAVAAVRGHAARLDTGQAMVVVTHGDLVKAVLADALGMHLDAFQRIVIAPASLSVVSYQQGRPFVERVNDCGGSLEDLLPPPRDEAVPGGHPGR